MFLQEAIGLLPRAIRTAANYRVYRVDGVHMLRFIRRERTLGFSMVEIRALLDLWSDNSRSSAAVRKFVGQHVAELRAKVAELQSMVSRVAQSATSVRVFLRVHATDQSTIAKMMTPHSRYSGN
jgi:MerR family copper efflux transcriptional regulator